jgi:C-terminal processing protease CtpA/Prc
MKKIILLCFFLTQYSCDFRSSKASDNQFNKDLINVTDSISQLMSDFHYNPSMLTTDEYLKLEKEVNSLAKSAQSKQEFITGFNELWTDGPFSHVVLALSDRRAEDMADFIDSLRVGDQSVNLEWKDQTAVLTVNTMTGLDTYERIFEVYQEIANNDTDALIIDVRNNQGGTFAILPLVSHILTDSIDAGYFVSRKWWTNYTKTPKFADVQKLTPWVGWSIKSFWNDVQEKPLTRIKFGPMNPHFDGPVYVLTSNISASATEFAVDALAHEENVTIIGETTAGEMLSQKMYDLPLGFQLSLPIAEYYSTRIGRIEGKGVEADISIDQSAAIDLSLSLINGMKLDDALSKAKEKMAKMNEKQ